MEAVLIAVTIMALFEVALRPLLMALALPIGLIAVALIGLLFRIALFLIILPRVGIAVDNVLVAIVASGIYAAVLTFLGGLIGMSDEDSFSARVVAQVVRDDERADHRRAGVVFVQIDGLAEPLLAAQLRPAICRRCHAGCAPARTGSWMDGHAALADLGQPGGLLLGSNDGIPAFRWYEKEHRRLMVSNHGKDAEEIERRLDRQRAAGRWRGQHRQHVQRRRAHHAADHEQGRHRPGPGGAQAQHLLPAGSLQPGRTLVRTIGEALKEYTTAAQQARRDVEPRMHRGGTYPWLRAATNVTLRDLNLALVSEQMLRGTPSIYVDFRLRRDRPSLRTGADRSDPRPGGDRPQPGPARAARRDCPRPYRFVILSDHGQSLGATFRQRYGQTVEELIRERIQADTVREAVEPTEQWGRLSTVLTEVSATDGAASRHLVACWRTRPATGWWSWVP